MDKYYTPEINEFFVGFEFEIFKDDNWTTFNFNVDEIISVFARINDKTIISDKIRIKYLDKEDIESLGWKGQESNSVYFTKDNYRLVHWITNDGRDINIFEKYDGGTQEECIIRKAKVKNKSELIKLLKQLNIG